MRLRDRYLHLMSDIEKISSSQKIPVDDIIEQLAIGEMVEKEHTGNQNEAMKIALDHLKEDINYYYELAEMEQRMFEKNRELRNVKDFPSVHYCKHIQAGVAQYKDEMLLIENETLKKMMPSMAGVPVYVDHQDVNLETLQKDADGYVSECFYNKNDGWFWAKFLAVSDKCKEAITNNYSVSNAYIPTDDNRSGGQWHNVQYDREVTAGVYTHLAIVKNPRYEGACIMSSDEFKRYNAELENEFKELKNSKTEAIIKTGGINIMKFFRNKKEEVTNLKDTDLSDVSVELTNGKEVSISEMIKAVENQKNEEKEEKENEAPKVDENTKINVCGKEMTLKNLKSEYEDMMNKKNAADEEAKKKEEEEKKNAEEEEKKKKEEEEKKNSKNFETLKNSIGEGNETQFKTNYETRSEKLKRGSERY